MLYYVGDELDPAELEDFVADLAATPDRWRHLVHHATDVRVYEQIVDDEDVNAWVICWSEDQDTGITTTTSRQPRSR